MGTGVPLNILFVVPYAPTRIRTRPFHLIQTLRALGHDVTVGTVWTDDEERTAVEALLSAGRRETIAERLSVGRALWNCAWASAGRDPLQAHFSWSPRLARRLVEAIQARRFDIVHVEHLRGARYGLALVGTQLGDRHGRPGMVWDSVDCISRLWRLAARESLSRRGRWMATLERARTERYEGAVARQFDTVLLTSESDRRDLVRLARSTGPTDTTFEVVPNGVDLDHFSPPSGPRMPQTLVMTGKMSYHANATAAVRFVSEVMPIVWSSCPDVRLYIVGKDPPAQVVKLGEPSQELKPPARRHAGTTARVFVTGTVADVRPYLRAATVAVAPLQYGVGIQNKVLEAMACATPVVATPQAVSALEVRAGEHVVVASTPDEMGSAIVGLMQDSRQCGQLGLAGRAFVACRHDWRAVTGRLVDTYRATRSLRGAA